MSLRFARPCRAVSLLALLCLLASCNRDKPPEAACPRGVIPADAAKITRFRDGPGRDLTDVVAEGQIQDILIQCKYDKKSVDIDLQIAGSGSRGPADRSRLVEFEYWVAVVNPEKKILTRQQFTVRFEFKDNETRISTVEQIEPVIPLADVMTGPSYEIWIAFQLTPEQMAWNREQRAKQ